MEEQYTKEMLFGKKKPSEEKKEKVQDEIKIIELDKLVDFREGQPFSYSDDDYKELKESIKKYGVYEPIIVREIQKNLYEILNGHHRVKCSRELGLTDIKAIVKDCKNNDEANYMLLELTLKQRKDLLPCEKGFAYKKQLELLKKIKNENAIKTSDSNDLEATVHSEQLDSIDELSASSVDGRTTIQRLIRLTELITELQAKVNNKDLSILAGVELSYISVEEQNIINQFIESNSIKLSVAQAELLRASKGEITLEEIENILYGRKKKKQAPKFTGKIKKATYKKYKDKFSSDDEFDILINELLEKHFNS